MTALVALSRVIDRFNETVGAVTAWLILAAVLISAGNAVSRKALNMASNAWLELQWYLFGAVFLLAAAYTLKCNEHVRVDILYGTLSRRKQHMVDLFGHVLFLMPFVSLMVYYLVPYTLNSINSGERSPSVGGLVIWPAKALLLVGFILLALQGVSEIIKKIAILADGPEDPSDVYAAKAPLEIGTSERETRE